MFCWKCNKEIKSNEVYRTTECPDCHAQLHCCKGCKFYAPGSHFDCHENVEELVVDKEKANFCDYFSPKLTESDSKNKKNKADAAKDAFNALLGGIVCL